MPARKKPPAKTARNSNNIGTLVWVVYPDKQMAKVYEAGQRVKTILADGSLDGGRVLPGFKLSLKDIFTE